MSRRLISTRLEVALVDVVAEVIVGEANDICSVGVVVWLSSVLRHALKEVGFCGEVAWVGRNIVCGLEGTGVVRRMSRLGRFRITRVERVCRLGRVLRASSMIFEGGAREVSQVNGRLRGKLTQISDINSCMFIH